MKLINDEKVEKMGRGWKGEIETTKQISHLPPFQGVVALSDITGCAPPPPFQIFGHVLEALAVFSKTLRDEENKPKMKKKKLSWCGKTRTLSDTAIIPPYRKLTCLWVRSLVPALTEKVCARIMLKVGGRGFLKECSDLQVLQTAQWFYIAG